MKKTFLVSVLAITATLTLAGCTTTKTEEPVESNVDTQQNTDALKDDIANEIKKEENEDADKEVRPSKPNTNEKENTNTSKDDTIDKTREYNYSDVKHIYNLNKQDVLNIFGAPDEEVTQEMYDGIDGTTLIFKDSVVDLYHDTDANKDTDSKVFCISTSENKIKHIKGIKVGDTVEQVLGKFPNSNSKEKKEYDMMEEAEYTLLYGKYIHRQNFGVKIFEKNTDNLIALRFGDENTIVEFTIGDGKVDLITYQMGLD